MLLTVIYDDRCEFCRRCRIWLSSQSQLVPLAFLPASDPAVAAWASRDGSPSLAVGEELIVLDQGGSVWAGTDAFLVCLWALRRYRSTAERLATPALQPLARGIFHSVSAGRGAMSGLLTQSICDEGCNL